ncbi:MAG: ATP-binding protein [Anaerolineae bacterium]|nr:ATP-binding protein [Anaerolineae bacterium]
MNIPILFSDTPGMLPLWTWECNLDGIYTACSPEVILCLGINPDQVIGQSLFDFRLLPESTLKIKESLKSGRYPAEVRAVFLSSQNEEVPGKINLFELFDESNQLIGWRGFNQIILGSEDENSLPQENRVEAGEISGINEELNRRTGISWDHGRIELAAAYWSAAGRKSAMDHLDRVEGGDPAVMAIPFDFGNYGSGLVEVEAQGEARTWSASEVLLVKGVVTQLTATLEKLLLKAVLEQETQDRARAEGEILRRNQDLSKLSKIGQQLGRLSSHAEVFNFIFDMLGEMIDNRNLIIARYTQDKEISFPFVAKNGLVLTEQYKNDFAGSVVRYVTTEKEPLLLTGASTEEYDGYKISLPDIFPAAVMAVPMLAGDRPVGAIILLNYEDTQAFNFIHLELLSTIAAQVSAALENVSLFQEIRQALLAIEIRERYQANIARAVALLSQGGTQMLPQFLELVGQAADCSRVVYVQYFEAGDENHWKIIKHWPAATLTGSLPPLVDYQVSLSRLPAQENAPEKGWLSGALYGRFEDGGKSLGSFLFLTVPGKSLWRSYISVEQYGAVRTWQKEEIDILKVAADALSNTIIREGLMDQLQASLDETENLYQASHQLALSSGNNDMLASLSKHLSPPQIQHSILVLFENNDTGQITGLKPCAVWHSDKVLYNGGWKPDLKEICLPEFIPDFQKVDPVFYDEVRFAPMGEDLRSALIKNGIVSLAMLPLWASKRQLGVMLLIGERSYHFSNRDMRLFPPLVDQMSIAIENEHAHELTQKALNDIKEVDRLKSQFLATMSHELRSPLNSIIGFSQVILKGIDGPVTDLQQHDLTAIYESGQLLLSLINDVLDLSKIEAGKMELALAPISLEDVINSAISSTRGLIKNKPITIRQEVKEHLPVINADAIRIRQVLINLLSNAVKFTEMGTVTVKAWVTNAVDGKKEAWVTVTDTGMGITPENQKKLFQAFTQVDSSQVRHAGGSGLGLSISRSLIDLHHGRIGILQSIVNQGSTFYFTLPVD